MSPSPITAEQLRRDVAAVLDRYEITVEEFLNADIDDFEEDELRDLWLMTRSALSAA